ncbi:MAG: PAS domain-containing protein [Pseudomonadota bacterium]
MPDVTLAVAALVPLATGLALVALAAMGFARRFGWAACLGGAALVASAQMVFLTGDGGGDGPLVILLGSTTYAVSVAVLAAAAGVCALRAVFVSARTTPFAMSGGRQRDEAPSDTQARSGIAAPLRALLHREHDKFTSAHDMIRYVELATRNSQITIFLQNAKLEYAWIVNPRLGLSREHVIGRSDYEIIPEEGRALVVGHKERAMATGRPQAFEVELKEGSEHAWFRVDVVPILDKDDKPEGVVCAAIDITRAKRLDGMRTELARRLAETLHRFNLALRSEKIVVFSQDLDMRYVWANADETQIGSVVGRTDDEVIPSADRPAVEALKRSAIERREARSGEVGIGEGADRRWYDLYVEPNVQADGIVTGITCASIDITHRKRNEEQMRLVMRELSHRTKNLLAVMIAITRNTSLNATSVDAFVPALIGRLRALSAAQDLLVADDWAGVGLKELVNAIVGQMGVRAAARVSVEGPHVTLSPEAAQNLGLAIHELAANAAKFGSLASETGHLSISWTRELARDEERVRFDWRETGGKSVQKPARKGFGMMVIERNITRAMRADVDLDFNDDGFACVMSIPLSALGPMNRPDEQKLSQAV